MPAEIKPAYMGEAMLLRWGDTHSSGRTITIQLDEHVGDQHPFKGLKCGPNGQRMQVCAVLVDDHDEPQNPNKTAPDSPPPVGPAEAAGEGQDTRRSFDSLPRSQQAAIKCQDKDFQHWIIGKWDMLGNGVSAAKADEVLKRLIDVASKREFDTDPAKGEFWDRMLTSFKHRDQVR